MVKIKICGLKTLEDIQYANLLKPDYVGFVFTKSKRQVDKATAKTLIAKLAPEIKKVGVFVNGSLSEVKEIAHSCHLEILQFHGEENPEYCQNFQQEVWKAFQIKDEKSLSKLKHYQVAGYLLDTFCKDHMGGTGKTFNWSLVSEISQTYPLILAGGLTVDNVLEAIRITRAEMVDVSSGVEVAGRKDFLRMKQFIDKVRG